jgi:hypothetical protein
MGKERLSAAQAKNISNQIIAQQKENEVKLKSKLKYYFDFFEDIFNSALNGKKEITKKFNNDDDVNFTIMRLLDREFEVYVKKDDSDLRNQINLTKEKIFDIYKNSEIICQKISAEILDILDLHPEYIENNYWEFDGYLTYPEIDFDKFYDSIPYLNQAGNDWIVKDHFKHYDIVKNSIELDFLNWNWLTIEWQKELQSLLLILFNNIEERNNEIKILATKCSLMYSHLDLNFYATRLINKNNLANFEKNESLIFNIEWGNEILDCGLD